MGDMPRGEEQVKNCSPVLIFCLYKQKIRG